MSAVCLSVSHGRLSRRSRTRRNAALTRVRKPAVRAAAVARRARSASGAAWCTFGSTPMSWSPQSSAATPTCSSPSTATWPNPSCAARISASGGSSSTPTSPSRWCGGRPAACSAASRRRGCVRDELRVARAADAVGHVRRRGGGDRIGDTVCPGARWLDLTLPAGRPGRHVGHAAAAGLHGHPRLAAQSGGLPERAEAVAADRRRASPTPNCASSARRSRAPPTRTIPTVCATSGSSTTCTRSSGRAGR